MRINEIADASEQIALWKLIADNVWTALDTQQRQQAQQNAVKKSRAKSTAHASSYKKPVKIPAPRAPAPLPKPNLQQQVQNQVQQNAQRPPSASAVALANQPKPSNTVRYTASAQRNPQTEPAQQDAKTALSVHNRGDYAKLLQLHNQHLQQRQA